MQALRAHKFFASINWSTLWTDPAPPLEAGLVKKPPPKEGRTNGLNTWDDVGAAWDEMLDGERGDDEISWASDGEAPSLDRFRFGSAPSDAGATGEMAEVASYGKDAMGPMGETRPYAAESPEPGKVNGSAESAFETSGRKTPQPAGASTVPNSGPGVRFAAETTGTAACSHVARAEDEPPDSGAEADEDRDTVPPTLDIPAAVRATPIDVPLRTNGVRDSYSTGSATSSSDGSPPMGGLDAALENMSRGRNRAQTPIQGNGSTADEEAW